MLSSADFSQLWGRSECRALVFKCIVHIWTNSEEKEMCHRFQVLFVCSFYLYRFGCSVWILVISNVEKKNGGRTDSDFIPKLTLSAAHKECQSWRKSHEDLWSRACAPRVPSAQRHTKPDLATENGLSQKLWGCRENLERTVNFIRTTWLPI